MSIVVLSNQLFWLLLYAGNIEQAAEKLAKATKLYPEHQITREMSWLFHYLPGDYSRAIELSLRAIDVNEKDHSVWTDLVLAYSAAGKREDARKWLAKIERLPEDARFRSTYIAAGYAALGELDEFFIWLIVLAKRRS